MWCFSTKTLLELSHSVPFSQQWPRHFQLTWLKSSFVVTPIGNSYCLLKRWINDKQDSRAELGFVEMPKTNFRRGYTLTHAVFTFRGFNFRLFYTKLVNNHCLCNRTRKQPSVIYCSLADFACALSCFWATGDYSIKTIRSLHQRTKIEIYAATFLDGAETPRSGAQIESALFLSSSLSLCLSLSLSFSRPPLRNNP